jgi:hypothetical protein
MKIEFFETNRGPYLFLTAETKKDAMALELVAIKQNLFHSGSAESEDPIRVRIPLRERCYCVQCKTTHEIGECSCLSAEDNQKAYAEWREYLP